MKGITLESVERPAAVFVRVATAGSFACETKGKL